MSTLKLVPASGSPVEVDGDKAMVGRDAGADILVNDSSVSRKHARLERWGSNWAVIDQRSANGTFLDGQRVTESVLQQGQELRFGKVAYRVEIASAEFGATVMMSSPVSDATVVQAPPATPARPAAPHPVTPAPPAVPRPVPPRPVAAPPAPAPYVAPHPEPGREGKGPLFWIAMTFGMLLMLAVIGFGVVMGPAFLTSRAAVDAARAQLKDLAEGDVDAAYARSSARYQAAHPAEAFAAFVERHPGLRRNNGSDFGDRSVQGDTVKISGTLTHGAGTEKAYYELVKEGGEWKVSGLEVDGDEGRAAASSGSGSGPSVETIAVNKSRQGQTITIKIDVRVTGFDLRPEGKLFRVDLAEDLETIGPDGKRIDELSRVGLETYNQTTSSATDAAATFNNSLTFTRAEPGGYKAVITIRDRVGQKSKKHEVPFDLP
jgi:hypothetical protein